MAILKSQNLSKKYGTGHTEVDALIDVAISIEKGEFAAVMGTSGPVNRFSS